MNIAFLADHVEFVPTLARWIFTEWSYLHPERTAEEVERLTAKGCNRDTLPITLVAFENARPIGTITLKEKDFQGRPDLNPWLSGLYVEKSHRGKGIGTTLVHELEQLAARRGVTGLYLVTDDAVDFYVTLDWQVLEQSEQNDLRVTVMEKHIAAS